MTYIIGITGKPGTGKSYVARAFRKLGMRGWNADESSARIFETDAIQDPLKKRYGQLFSGGHLDRQAFLMELWENPRALEFLESLMHPAIEEDLKSFLFTRRDEKFLWMEVPLLFEAHWESYCDCILVTHCTPEVAHARLSKRGWSLERIKALDQRYPALEQYIQSGLPTFHTNGTKQETWQQLRKCIEDYKAIKST